MTSKYVIFVLLCIMLSCFEAFAQDDDSGGAAVGEVHRHIEQTEEQVDNEDDVDDHVENTRLAAEQAKHAANVANVVANHAKQMTRNAQSALHHAANALKTAEQGAKENLSEKQLEDLAKAQDQLAKATQEAKYGKVREADWVDGGDQEAGLAKKIDSLQDKMANQDPSQVSVEDQMRQKLEELRERYEALRRRQQAGEQSEARAREQESMRSRLEELKRRVEGLEGEERQSKISEIDELEGQVDTWHPSQAARSQEEVERDMADLQGKISDLQKELAEGQQGDSQNARSSDELKAEIEAMRKKLEELENTPVASPPSREISPQQQQSPQSSSRYVPQQSPPGSPQSHGASQGPLEQGFDVDTEMPFGELEPFGREDTAQELTAASINESNEMVDQMERAEVAEEKRSVFRALTRLRGAAITSFDGVARAHTGNIDEYAKIHQWRQAHPVHHLAEEESDVHKWAFPDTADF